MVCVVAVPRIDGESRTEPGDGVGVAKSLRSVTGVYARAQGRYTCGLVPG